MSEKTVTIPINQDGNRTGLPVPKKLTDWPKEPEVKTLKEDLQGAQPAHDMHLAKLRHWRDLRDGTLPSGVQKLKGRSKVQPKLIRRQQEWRNSALSEPFNSSPDLYQVEPATFEDEFAAKQNQTLLNWQFRTKLNKVAFIDNYVRTAVEEGTVIVRTGWQRVTKMEKVQEPVFEMLEPTAPEELDALEQALALKVQNPAAFGELPQELRAAAEYTIETQVPVVARIAGYEEVAHERVLVNQPTVDVVDPANIFIDPSCQGDINKARFIVYSFETSKAELIKDGRYKNLDTVNWSGAEILAQPDHETTTPGSFNFKDELRKRIVAYEYWGYIAVDDSDELKPIIATWVGDVMIRLEENPFPDEKPPFVLARYLPVKRQMMGEPDAEILEDNQKVLGATYRGVIDLMARSANAQQGMAKGFLDPINRRRFEQGMDYEFNPSTGDPRLSVYQHQYPEIPNSALTMIQIQNTEAEALSGVKAFSGGLSGEAYGDVAAGIKGMLDAAAKREMNILRRLAQGIKEIGDKIIAMNAVFLSEEEVVRVTNREFVKIKREDLAGNFDLIVDIATAEVDEAKAQDLSFMLQTMGPDMAPEMSRMILAEIADLKRQKALAEKIRNFQPTPDPVVEQIKQLELQKLQMEIAKLQSEVAKNQAAAQASLAQAGKAKTEADLNNLDFVEQETGTKHARDMQKQSEQARANQDLEVTKSLLKPRKQANGVESRPELEAAIGWNRISDAMNSRVM